MDRRPPFTPSPLRIWAVEDTSIQLSWGRLKPGQITAKAADAVAEIDHLGGPGVLTLAGLPPDAALSVEVTFPGGRTHLTTRTLAPPPGELLARVATVSDLHLGAERWGFFKTMVEEEQFELPHPVRCATSAIAEANDWGAELIVIKGDAAHHRHPDNFAQLGHLVDRFPDTPMLLVPGNHDVDFVRSEVDLPATVGVRELEYIPTVASRDLAGVRVIAANTTIAGKGDGTLHGVGAEIIEQAASAPAASLVAVHHHFHRFAMMTHWPPGISKAEADPFFEQLAANNPRTVVTSGHSHRNRARIHAGLTVTEVASTRDWPGVWAGYAVHEGGIRQVVRRAAAPDAVVWHEYSRGAVLGLWDHWAPGPLNQRCLNVTWS